MWVKVHVFQSFLFHIFVVLFFQEDAVAELEKLHSEQELHIMELFHTVEQTIEKIEDGCRFAENVIKQGNAIEVC